MVKRFAQVDNNLYRGGKPSEEDIKKLYKFGIRKIISLDEEIGNNINNVCKSLGIEHLIFPLKTYDISSLKDLFRFGVKKIFESDKQTYIHCKHGKDRTGLLVALYRCIFNNYSARQAILEALSFGFGKGVDPKVIHLYQKLIHKIADKQKDINENNDIVSNIRDLTNQYRDFTLDSYEQQSWSPYADYRIKRYPEQDTNREYQEQYFNREERLKEEKEPNNSEFIEEDRVPMVGVWDVNTQGINGAGPSYVGTGFI